MANSSRTDRQLMRRRGAGLRDVDAVDFGLNFATQGTRDDRQLMRQRGAGRKVDNVDFGFSFPTPSQSRRSSRTPQTAKRDARQPSRTPVSNGRRQSSAPRAVQAHSAQSQDALSRLQRSSKTPQRDTEPVKPNSGKRRRVSKNIESVNPKTILVNIPRLPPPLSEVSNIARSQEVQNTIPVESDEATRSDDLEGIHQAQTSTSASLPVHIDADKEHMMSPTNDLGLMKDGRRNQPSSPPPEIGEDHSGTTLEAEEVVQSVEEPEATGLHAENDDSTVINTVINTVDHSRNSSQPEPANQSFSANTEAADHIAESNSVPRKRKKRKSVVLGPRKKRRTSESIRQSLSVARVEASADEDTRPASPENQGQSEEEQEATENEPEPVVTNDKDVPLWKRLAARRMQGRRNRLSVSASPAPCDEDEEADETYVEEDGSPEPPTPAVKRKKGSKKFQKRSADGRTNVKPGVKSNRTSFPIVTYRTTDVEALPTIVEEDGDENSEADGVRLPSAFSNRSQPNAVDVLAQICRESIQTALEKLEAIPAASTSRAEIKHKRTALETFGERVDQRLFDMSQAVEQRMTSEARLRKSKREKAELQARWIEVRRQRDELALKADTIRRRNWDNEEEGKRRFEVSELAHRTELELERDESKDDDNLEFMLRHVADNVSSTAGQGGILNRVRSFNGQLERIAAALEGR